MVHRDLKPENLLFSSPEPDAIVKISDFGLAKVISDELMTTACGTPGYVAPEIFKNNYYDNKIDVFSLGVIFYKLVYDEMPFEGNE